MRVLYYMWGRGCQDTKDAFLRMGVLCDTIPCTMHGYDEDEEFVCKVEELLRQWDYDLIFSFDYFPLLSKIADKWGIPYVSWIYDCPHLTLYSDTVSNSCNYFFLFDSQMCEQVRSFGALHVTYLPLAANVQRLNELLGSIPDRPSYQYDISFVGSLYERNWFDQIQYLPPYLQGYLQGIMVCQQRVWSGNFVENTLTSEICDALSQYIHLGEGEGYRFDASAIYATMVNQKLTHQDRVQYLNALADQFGLDLFTNSDVSQCTHCTCHGTVDYDQQMPLVFRTSKININITLRSIICGIPRRCIDIMAAGGFLLTNYQPDLLRHFEPDVDFVYYTSQQDLVNKAGYYLQHDNEREQIARNGAKKVQEKLSYEQVIKKIWRTLNGEIIE